jgi:predicted metal-dependent hydrolase
VSTTGACEAVEVRRSARRRRTVTAYRENGRTVVLIPAAFSPAEERRWVAQMVAKLQTREERRRRGLASDADILARATTLSGDFLGGRAVPASVRWVDNQNRRWGSCTPSERTIRLSSRLRGMPQFVVDYVLVHELAHLIEPSHDERFWVLVRAYPRVERAQRGPGALRCLRARNASRRLRTPRAPRRSAGARGWASGRAHGAAAVVRG